MPTIIKREGGYQCRVRLPGHPHQSEMFDTKARASAWGHMVEAKLRDQAKGVVRATLGEAIEKYIADVCPTLKSGPNIAKRLRAIAKMLPTQRHLPDLTAAELSKFRDMRLGEVAVATVRKELTILRSVFESARRDWGMVQVNPLADVKKPPAPPNRNRLFVGDEAQRIVDALGYAGEVTTLQHQVAVALLLAFETAMRSGEIIGLEWSRVHLDAQYVTLPETKNGDQRDVPLSKRAVELLRQMKSLDPVQVFTVSPESRDALFRKARVKCKIEDLHFHDSRANAIVSLSKKLDIHELARMVGHRDIRSLSIYYRPTATTIAGKLG